MSSNLKRRMEGLTAKSKFRRVWKILKHIKWIHSKKEKLREAHFKMIRLSIEVITELANLSLAPLTQLSCRIISYWRWLAAAAARCRSVGRNMKDLRHKSAVVFHWLWNRMWRAPRDTIPKVNGNKSRWRIVTWRDLSRARNCWIWRIIARC